MGECLVPISYTG